jgi:hypothetical protein
MLGMVAHAMAAAGTQPLPSSCTPLMVHDPVATHHGKCAQAHLPMDLLFMLTTHACYKTRRFCVERCQAVRQLCSAALTEAQPEGREPDCSGVLGT